MFSILLILIKNKQVIRPLLVCLRRGLCLQYCIAHLYLSRPETVLRSTGRLAIMLNSDGANKLLTPWEHPFENPKSFRSMTSLLGGIE